MLPFSPLCSFMDDTNPSADAGGGVSVQLAATFLLGADCHIMRFSVFRRDEDGHSLSTRFYICHTVAVLEQQSLLQLAFLAYGCLSATRGRVTSCSITLL